MQDVRATPLLLGLKIAAAAATKMLGLKPLAGNVIILGSKHNVNKLQKIQCNIFLTRHPRNPTAYQFCDPIPGLAPVDYVAIFFDMAPTVLHCLQIV